MASRKFPSISVLAILASVALCNCLQISDEYLEEPLRVEAFDDTVEGLNEMDLNGVTTPGKLFEALEALEKTLESEGTYKRSPARFWIDLTKPVENCEPDWPKSLIYNYYVLKDTTEIQKKQVFFDFMEQFGRKKVEKCAPEALATIEAVKNSQDVLDAVQFFKRITFLEDGASDGDLNQKLKLISVSDTERNFQFLAREALRYDGGDKLNGEDVKDMYHFLFVDHCRKFNAKLGDPLLMINVAAALNPGGDYFKVDDNLGTLREVRRICLDVSRFRRGFYANLSAKMDSKEKILIPMAKKLGLQKNN